MTQVLQNPPHVPGTPHVSNGARLVSRTGEDLPLRGITLTSEAVGGVARTVLRQQFANPYPQPLELTYQFPLPADGAVAGYEVHAGSRVIKGKVAPREQARAAFEEARVEGRTAALLDQERPNLFTQHLGNIPASTDVTVELTIDHPLAWIPGGAWEWRFPTVVAPRYLGAEGVVEDHDRVTIDVAAGGTSPTASVTLTVADDLHAAPTSPTHGVVVTGRSVCLADAASLDRDIVVRWKARTQTPGCSLHVMKPEDADGTDSGSAYGLLTIVPPAVNQKKLSRDLVLLLDISGSMDGRPLEFMKGVVVPLVESLEHDDRLEMIAFSSGQERYSGQPVRVTEAERRKATAWIRALTAGGGTEMISAIAEALRPRRDDVPRQVVIVTDGQIGFEAAAVRAIRDGLPKGSRLHAVGVGSASNRAFLRPAARAGRGVEVLLDLDEPLARGAERILAATREPVIVDLTLGGTAVHGDSPRLPDVLAGSPVVVPLRLNPSGGTLVVKGRTAHGIWEQSVAVDGTISSEFGASLPAFWARAAIEDLELDLACGDDRKAIDERIEQIALDYSVSSRLTSWVAIAEQPGVDPRDPVRIERIPQVVPYGMSAEGLGLGAAWPTLDAMMVTGSRFSAQASISDLTVSLDLAQLAAPTVRRRSTRMRRRFDEVRGLVEYEMDRLRALVAAINEAAVLVRALDSLPSADRDSATRLHDLTERLERMVGHERGIPSSADLLEPLIQQLREVLEQHLEQYSLQELVSLRGRIAHTPTKPTTTIEIVVTFGLMWRPEANVTIAGRTVAVVTAGTTRPGPIAAGSLVRLELAVAPGEIVAAGSVEVTCGDDLLTIVIDAAQ